MVYQFDIFCTYRTQSMIRSHLLISQLKVIFHMTKKKSHAIRNWETRRRPKHLSVQLQLNERGVTISRGAVLRPNGASVITAIHWSWHPLRKGPFSIQGHYTAHKCTNNSVSSFHKNSTNWLCVLHATPNDSNALCVWIPQNMPGLHSWWRWIKRVMDFSLKASSKALKWQATEKSMDTFDIVSKQYKKHVSDALDQWFQTGGPDPPRGGPKIHGGVAKPSWF